MTCKCNYTSGRYSVPLIYVENSIHNVIAEQLLSPKANYAIYLTGQLC